MTRTDGERELFHPERRIPVVEALAASTRSRWLIPVIRVDDRADPVVTDADPLDADARTLREMPVHATMVAGTWTHLPPD